MQEPTDLTAFERAVLHKLVAGDDPVLRILQQQAEVARVLEREWHGGAGFFTELVVDLAAPWLGFGVGLQIHDVSARISGLHGPTSYVLWVDEGRMSALEGTLHSEDEPWPDTITQFALSYYEEPRSLDLPRLGEKARMEWRR